jgi:hypothetical protein
MPKRFYSDGSKKLAKYRTENKVVETRIACSVTKKMPAFVVAYPWRVTEKI